MEKQELNNNNNNKNTQRTAKPADANAQREIQLNIYLYLTRVFCLVAALSVVVSFWCCLFSLLF